MKSAILESQPYFIPRSTAITTAPVPKLLLIDDDPLFCHAFQRYAKNKGVAVRCFQNFFELHHPFRCDFNVALVDYDLGKNFNGIHLAEYLAGQEDHIPVMLVSQNLRNSTSDDVWPHNIRGFTLKSLGIEAVFNNTLRMFSRR